jgi:hypothetical protein
MSAKVYKPSGVKIDVISTHDDGEYFMVRSNTTGKVFFAHKDQIDEFKEDLDPKPSQTQSKHAVVGGLLRKTKVR